MALTERNKEPSVFSIHLSRYYEQRRLLEGSPDHEEAETSQTDSALCRLHGGGTNVHRYRTHDQWSPAGLFADT